MNSPCDRGPMEPIPARIVGGPIALSDYNHLRLAVDHTATLPDGSTVALPAGTLLTMNAPGGRIEQEGGLVMRSELGKDPRDGAA